MGTTSSGAWGLIWLIIYTYIYIIYIYIYTHIHMNYLCFMGPRADTAGHSVLKPVYTHVLLYSQTQIDTNIIFYVTMYIILYMHMYVFYEYLSMFTWTLVIRANVEYAVRDQNESWCVWTDRPSTTASYSDKETMTAIWCLRLSTSHYNYFLWTSKNVIYNNGVICLYYECLHMLYLFIMSLHNLYIHPLIHSYISSAHLLTL